MRHIFIVNPAAGKGTEHKSLTGIIQDACRASGASFSIYITNTPGDATSFVREAIAKKPAGEVYRFYACGGDGTLSEVISGALNVKAGDCHGALCNVEVGCIPIGTGNDFVRNFTNASFFKDVTKQLLADAAEVDCYAYGEGKYGINMINIGFDCDVAARAAEIKKKPFMPKSLAYIAGIVSVLKKNLGKRITVRYDDGTEITKEFQLVSAANGGFCGGGFNSAPRSSLSDGFLDVSLIDKVTRKQLICLVGSYKAGKHLDTRLGRKVVKYTKSKSVTFEFSEPTNVCIDGEIEMCERVSMRILPRAVRFAIPVGCELR